MGLSNILNNSTWSNNVMLGTCSDSHSGTPYCAAELSTTDVTNATALYAMAPVTYFPNTTPDLTARAASMQWFDLPRSNFRLNRQSPYVSGSHASSDGRDIGADIDALEVAQGKVSNVHQSAFGTSTASLTWLAPDSYACTFDYGTANFPAGSGSWTRATSTATGPAGARVQSAIITGLSSATKYTGRVNCQVQQPVVSFHTN
jgi:hypothetical protein